MTNYIADSNRFKLPAPPQWFQKMLWDFDAALVVIPSRQRTNTYLLARRRQKSLQFHQIAKQQADLEQRTRASDSDMLAYYNLVFVDTISGTFGGTWSPTLIQSLRERDTWAAGGGTKYADKIDAADKKIEQTRHAKLAGDMEHRAGDGWRSYQARTGQRTRPTIPAVKEKSSSRTAGSGIVITG